MVKLKVTSDVAKTRRKLAKLRREFVRGMGNSMMEQANAMSAQAKRNTPTDTGNLKASHYVTKPKIRGWKATVTVGVGSAVAWYARIVHEMPNKPGWKFLERPVAERTPRLVIAIHSWLRRSAKRLDL